MRATVILGVLVLPVLCGAGRASDCLPPPCVGASGRAKAAADPPVSEPHVEEVTLLVRGMMKSRSGAT